MSITRRQYYGFRIYHVIARGNNRERILKEDLDKKIFLLGVRKYQIRFGFKVYAFVIMDNHVHLLMETSEDTNISQIMQRILLSYSCRFRKRYDWVGHVWQGRFKSKPVVNEGQMLENIRYIHDNPARAQIVTAASKYDWSSAKFYEQDQSVGTVSLIAVTRWE